MQEVWTFLAATMNQFMADNATVLSVAVIFMFLDILTGIVVSLIKGTYSSTKLREGLGHKFGFVMCMCAVAVIQLAMFDPKFQVNFNFPIFNAVCAAIIFMEFTSIIENAAVICPQIDEIFGKFMEKGDEAEEEEPGEIDLDELTPDEISKLVIEGYRDEQ